MSNRSTIAPKLSRARPGPERSDASGAAESDRHRAVFDDHRDCPAALAELEHPRKLRRVLLDVDVSELDMPPCEVVTGGLGVGSRILAEDLYHPSILKLSAHAFAAARANVYSAPPPIESARPVVDGQSAEVVAEPAYADARVTGFVGDDA